MSKTFRINRLRQVHALPVIDTFDGETNDCAFLSLTVHQAEDGQKFYMLGSAFTVLAWTTDARAAFRAFNDAPAYTWAEFEAFLRSR